MSEAERRELLRQLGRQFEKQSSIEPMPSLADLLEQAQQDSTLLPDLQLGEAASALTRNELQAGQGNRTADSTQAIDPQRLRDAARTMKEALPDGMQKRLDKSGWSNLIKELVQESKSEVRQQAMAESGDGDAAAAASPLAGLESAVIEAFADAAVDLGEFAKDMKDSASKQKNGRNSSGSSSPAGDSGQAGSAALGGGASSRSAASGNTGLKSAGENLFSNRDKPNEARSATSSDGRSQASGEFGGISVPAELLAAVVLVAGVGLYFLFSNRGGQTGNKRTPQRIEGVTIRSRQDVVQAFHLLTQRCLEPSQHWWTHRRAASSLGDKQPSWELALRRLADIYEQARYLPSEVALTDEELRAAQRAWDHCNA
jgi:hypothetical protein